MFKKRRQRSKSEKFEFQNVEELILPAAKLRFCPDQLQNLNFIFLKKLEEKESAEFEKTITLARSVTERLVQRLVCCAGMLDERFASKYLISCPDQGSDRRQLRYLLRLDGLSTPPLYVGDPPPRYSIVEDDAGFPAGYARLRLHPTLIKAWGDCTSPSGFLRRDRVQARLVELLAQAASSDFPTSPLHVDESVLCAAPGKVVDAAALHRILATAAEEQVFYGAGGGAPRFPDPRDFRLAIADEPAGVRLRVEFLSPALAGAPLEVRLLAAIGVDAWPAATDFPARVPLGHADCLLHHQAAQTGMFLVGFGVQSSAWQVRLPAAEAVLLGHHGPRSVPHTVVDVLSAALAAVDRSCSARRNQATRPILSGYLFRSLLLQTLEASAGPLADLVGWSPLHLSTIVLRMLDALVGALHEQELPHYFFGRCNLLANPGHLCEDDYVLEANGIRQYLVQAFDEALAARTGDDEFERMLLHQRTEAALLHKWRGLVEGLLPPAGARGRRLCFDGPRRRAGAARHAEYTSRQLEYIGLLLKQVLNVKQRVLQADAPMGGAEAGEEGGGHHLEDVIYIIVTIMEQAREQYLIKNSAIIKNKPKYQMHFNMCTSKLVELIRKDKDCSTLDFQDDLLLVEVILKWLYKAMDENKRHLAPILRPYLSEVFTSSHIISWHLSFIKQRLNTDELKALGLFAKLVNSKQITPAQGLIDAVNKNWAWAKSMLAMVEKNTLRIVFVADRGKVVRHILSLPSYNHQKERDVSVSQKVKRTATLPCRSYFRTILAKDKYTLEITPTHDVLKLNSPLTLIVEMFHRKGEHRGYGDILQSLLSMQKLSMFQQIAACLSEEDRSEIMELVQSLRPKKSLKKWSRSMPSLSKGEAVQRYTPRGDFANTVAIPALQQAAHAEAAAATTLIGGCRAARIREDTTIQMPLHFKAKGLLLKSESFKY